MSVRVKKISDNSLFAFTCAQWALMEQTDRDNWAVLENTCGFISNQNYPYAESAFFNSITGIVAADAPLTIQETGGTSTILFEDQAAGTVLAGPVSGPDDYPTFRALALTDLPDITETVQDAIGGILVDSDTIDFTYNDATPSITAAVRTQMSITSDTGGAKLSGDSASPGNNKLYGTDGSGVKGWYDQPSGGGVSDGDKGDITVSAGGTTWTIDNNVVTDATLRQGAAASVIGRSAATGGNVADIVSTANHQVLRRNDSGVLEFGLVGTDNIVDLNITTGKIAALAVTTAKIADANVTTAKIADLNITTAKIADLNVTTGKIANNAVTYAKIQQVAATNRFLGRKSAGAGNVEEITVADAYAILGLTGTANRFALWTGANTLTSDAAFTFDAANDRMTITSAGVVNVGVGIFNIDAGTVAGTSTAIRSIGDVRDNFTLEHRNTRNTNTSAHAIINIGSGGTAAGDPIIQFQIVGAGGVTHSIGTDNSDSDKFKVTVNANAPGQNANKSFVVTNAATPLYGFNTDNPAEMLDVAGRSRTQLYLGIDVAWASGDISFGSGAGTGPTFTSCFGTHNWIRLKFSTGTSPTANNAVFTLVRKAGFEINNVGFPVLCAGNAATATDISKFYIGNDNGIQFTVVANGTLTASTPYELIICWSGY